MSLTRAARFGDAWLPGPTANLGKLLEAQQIYQQKLREAGSDPAARPTPLTREVLVADTDREAREVAEHHMLVSYREEYGTREWKHPLIGGEDATPPDQFDSISRDRFLVGAPETIIQQIEKYKTAFGVDHLICRLYFPGLSHDFILKELRLLAAEVMPAFK